MPHVPDPFDFPLEGVNLVRKQSPTTAAKVQIKATVRVFKVESFVEAITIGIAIANKIRDTQSQTLPMDERSETTRGNIKIDRAIRTAFFFVIKGDALPSFSSFLREGGTA